MVAHNNKLVSVSHAASKLCHRPLTHQCPSVHCICNLITDWNLTHFIVIHCTDWTRGRLETHFCFITQAPGVTWQKWHHNGRLWELRVRRQMRNDRLKWRFSWSIVSLSLKISPRKQGFKSDLVFMGKSYLVLCGEHRRDLTDLYIKKGNVSGYMLETWIKCNTF